MDPDGHVRLFVAVGDMIWMAGFKIFSSQIKAIVRRYPAVGQADAAGVADHYAGKMPKAFATLIKGAATTGPEFRDRLNARVASMSNWSRSSSASLCCAPIGRLDRRALTPREVSDRAIPCSGAA